MFANSSSRRNADIIPLLLTEQPSHIRYSETLPIDGGPIRNIPLDRFCEQNKFTFLEGGVTTELEDLPFLWTSSEPKRFFKDISELLADPNYYNRFVVSDMGHCGQGLFLAPDAKPIKAGKVVMLYKGSIQHFEENNPDLTYAVNLHTALINAFFYRKNKRFFIDAKKYGDLARFIQASPCHNDFSDAQIDTSSCEESFLKKIAMANLMTQWTVHGGVPILILRAASEIKPCDQLLYFYDEKYFRARFLDQTVFNRYGQPIGIIRNDKESLARACDEYQNTLLRSLWGGLKSKSVSNITSPFAFGEPSNVSKLCKLEGADKIISASPEALRPDAGQYKQEVVVEGYQLDDQHWRNEVRYVLDIARKLTRDAVIQRTLAAFQKRFDESITPLHEIEQIINEIYESNHGDQKTIGCLATELKRWVSIYEKFVRNRAIEFKKTGNALIGKQELEKALAEYNQGIEVCPFVKELWHNKGFVHLRLSQYQEAKEAFERALFLDPHYIKAKNSLKEVEGKLTMQEASMEKPKPHS